MTRARLGALIAGGRARRLGGRPKGLLAVDGVPVIDRLGRLLDEMCERVVIIGDPDGPYAGRGWPVVPDRIDAGAPGGVYTALKSALEWPPEAPGGPGRPGWVFTLACDMPRLDRTVLELLWAARAGQVTVFDAGGRRQPLAALWHTDGLSVFDAAFARGRPGFNPLIERLDAVELHAPSSAPFDDVDTPADASRLGIALPDVG